MQSKKSRKKCKEREYEKKRKLIEERTCLLKLKNNTDKPVAWCDCLMTDIKSKAPFSVVKTVKDDDIDCCEFCGYSVCFSINAPDHRQKLQKFEEQKKPSEWLPDHSVVAMNYTERREEWFEIKEVKEIDVEQLRTES